MLTVDLFQETRRRLLDLLSSLSDEQWRAPTVCAGWSVKDVALHLLGGDVANLSRRRDGLRDALNAYVPPGASLSDQTMLVMALNRWNEDWVMAARRISGPLLCDLLALTGADLHAYYASLDLMAMGGPVSWAGPEPAPVWLDVAREYTEQWTHQSQIRAALDLPSLDEPRLFAPVLATFMHALPHTLRSIPAADGACLRVVITGPAGGKWVALRQNQRWRLGHDAERPVTATATLDQAVAWRLFTLGLSRAEAERQVHLAGDRHLASAVLDMVAVIA